MATKRKSKTRRSGVVKVYNTAEMTTSFPKSRKLMKQYKFTVYGDGTIVKSEIKQGERRKKPRKKSAKKRQKGRRYEKDSQRYFGVIPVLAWGAVALIGGIYAYKIYKDEEQETLNAEIALENASIPNQKWKTARTVAFASTAVIIAYLYLKNSKR